MKILSIIVIVFGFSQCGNTKFVKNPLFKIDSATYNHWLGGLPGVGGTGVEIRLSEKGTVDFESLFFQKKSTKIEIREEKGTTFLMANFHASKREKPDLIFHSDAKMELKNKAPTTTNFPFDLKENEAIISYKVGNTTKYYKIENVEQIK